jgi:hypothetical protein
MLVIGFAPATVFLGAMAVWFVVRAGFLFPWRPRRAARIPQILRCKSTARSHENADQSDQTM